MARKNKPLADLRDVEMRRASGWGYELKCQKCGAWKRRLVITQDGKQVCEKCAKENG